MRILLHAGLSIITSISPVAPAITYAVFDNNQVKSVDVEEPPSIEAIFNLKEPIKLTPVHEGQSNQQVRDIAAAQATPSLKVQSRPVASRTVSSRTESNTDTNSVSSLIKDVARELVTNKWGAGQWDAFNTIVTIESGWNPKAVNRSSGACGLPQALPCSKIGGINAPETIQISWMIDYIADRYGTPSQALAFHTRMGWY